ncbi:MAG: hypothetical protein HYR92_05025, partial [Burkholderiales bacterium]|nr:hypothetical protein [Burkholderiales bacterium]
MSMKLSRRLQVKTLLSVLLATTYFVSAAAQASAIEQFKTFVVNTKTAQGEFVQLQMRVSNGVAKPGKSS